MNSKRLWTHVLGAAVSLIVLFAVPSLAQAHAGHYHEVEAPSAASASSPHADAGSAARVKHLASFAESQDQAPAKNALGCGGLSCCGNAPCPACASLISINNTDLEPLGNSAVYLPHNGHAVTGINPKDLSRPPKSFV